MAIANANSGTELYLLIEDVRNEVMLERYKVEEGDTFAVAFRHSVNQSMVEDRYKIVDGAIMVYETLYYDFGAGVQTELLGSETLTMTDDGGMIVGNVNKIIPELYYNISAVYDHILKIDNTEMSLKELAGGRTTVLFSVIVE
ncbi:MAG: DUF1850 domain-containing protein [Bacillota bacterium]